MVVFGEDWGRHPSSTQHLVKHLMHDRQVIWVNSIGLRGPRVSLVDIRRIAHKVKAVVGAPKPVRSAVQENATDQTTCIEIVAPFALPLPSSTLAGSINRALLSRQIRRRMATRRIKTPLLWVSLPTAVVVAGTLGERALIYYCGDDFGALAGVDHAPVLLLERELVEKADLILAASDVLAGRFPPHKTRVVPHGVDVELFTAPAARPYDLPTDRPVAGFYGTLASWIDFALVAHAARALPEWIFLLIGAIQADVSALDRLENVMLLGPRQHEELPGYVQNWTVSLIPFRNTRQIHAANPLKLREYLAAGPPIVTTAFPALAPYRDLVHVADDADGFARAISAAARSPDLSHARRARVSGESWAARAKEVSYALDHILDHRG